MYCIHIIFIVILFWKSNLTVNLVPTATHRGRVAARAPAALDASPGDLNPSTRSAGDAFAGAMIFGAGEILMKVVKAGLQLPRDDSGKRLFIADFWFKDGGWNCLSHHLIFQWLWLWREASLGYPQFLGSWPSCFWLMSTLSKCFGVYFGGPAKHIFYSEKVLAQNLKIVSWPSWIFGW